MIDTQSIRVKILDLAMRGELTGPLSEDGSVETLYSEIETEKLALARAGIIKKEKPLIAISEEDRPFPIPARWRWVYLGELFQHNTGKALNSNDTQGEQLEYITTSNLYWDRFVLDGLKTMPFMDSEIEKCTVKKGDLLVCEGGDIGRSAIWPYDFDMRIQNHIHRLRRYSRKICTEFYYYLLWLYKQTGRINGIGIGLQGFSAKRVHSLIVPLAPAKEAERAVEVIKQAFSVLNTIDTLQAQYADNLTVLKSKLIDAAIQGKLTEQLPEDGDVESLYLQIQAAKAEILRNRKGREEKIIKDVGNDVPYIIPKQWKWIRLGDLGLFKKGPFGSALTKSMFVPKDPSAIKVYEQQHAIKKDSTLGTYYISREYFDEKMTGFEVKSGDILISCAGTIGETYIVPEGSEVGIINQALMRVTLVPQINKKFFQYYFDSRLKGSAKAGNGSAIINIPPFDVIKNWYFPLAPIEEQKRIVSTLEELLPLCSTLK